MLIKDRLISIIKKIKESLKPVRGKLTAKNLKKLNKMLVLSYVVIIAIFLGSTFFRSQIVSLFGNSRQLNQETVSESVQKEDEQNEILPDIELDDSTDMEGSSESLDKPQEEEKPTILPALSSSIDLAWPMQGEVLFEKGHWYHVGNQAHYHRGIDIAAQGDKEVRAAAPGIISEIGQDNYVGNYLVIDHQNGFLTLYGNLEEIEVEEDEKVVLEQVLAITGQSAEYDAARGTHLHFELHREDAEGNQILLNPLDFLN